MRIALKVTIDYVAQRMTGDNKDFTFIIALDKVKCGGEVPNGPAHYQPSEDK